MELKLICGRIAVYQGAQASVFEGLLNLSHRGSTIGIIQASSNGGTSATCGTSEPLKNKGNFGTFGAMWHFGSFN